MVSIDTVYQKVLALANKEQRGYITPQEFNLIADKAQKEIFDSYFHDFKTIDLKPKTNLTQGDEVEMLQHKLSPFKKITSTTLTTIGVTNYYDQSIDLTVSGGGDLYWIESVIDKGAMTEIEELTVKEFLLTEKHPLTKASSKKRVYTRESPNKIKIHPQPTSDLIVDIYYYKNPTTPEWAYVVVEGNALYNSGVSTNFELHISEEEPLVAKILQLSGLVIMKPEVIQAGGGMEQAINQTQND